ncbi:MAG: DUF4124 domain-containing protein, partial [Deltaproteobacteria bacterium]|nr:DUF4124 domain-containing protein [Deltaproteobacteria bacterium]
MKNTTLITLALLLILPRWGLADIYRFVDDEGVVCFTDAPGKSGATLIMKERSAQRYSGKRSIPGHLAATGI